MTKYEKAIMKRILEVFTDNGIVEEREQAKKLSELCGWSVRTSLARVRLQSFPRSWTWFLSVICNKYEINLRWLMDGEGEKNKSLYDQIMNKILYFLDKVKITYPDESKDKQLDLALNRFNGWAHSQLAIDNSGKFRELLEHVSEKLIPNDVQSDDLDQVRKYNPEIHTYIHPVT